MSWRPYQPYPQAYPGGQPGMQPGMYPGMQPGMHPGMYPGMQPGMHPGMYPGMQPGMHPGMYPGMQPQPSIGGGVQVAPIMQPMEPELVELPHKSYRWVSCNAHDFAVPAMAMRGGVDADGGALVVGRTLHNGDLVPAKVCLNKRACYISFMGEELVKDYFEVLVPAVFLWRYAENGEIHPGAVETGNTIDEEKLYVGRVTADGQTLPGKIQPSHGVCYYTVNGEERLSAEYEVLVLY